MIRKLSCLLLALTLLAACSNEEPEKPKIESSQAEALLRSGAGASTSFTVTATAPWTLTTAGAGFDVAPTAGGRGETVVTVTATAGNPGESRNTLGTITLRLTVEGMESGVKVSQSPAVAPRTVFMYLPWTGPVDDLTSYFEQNIADMEQIAAKGRLGDERLLVYFMASPKDAELFEIYHDNGASVRERVKTYTEIPKFTTAEGIASILGDVRQAAPGKRHAMTIGCHGMAWLPAHTGSYAAGGVVSPRAESTEKEYWEYGGTGRLLTRWFGGTSSLYQTDIPTLAEGIDAAGMHMDYILFDDCYMSSVEVAYELRKVTDHLIGSTSEIMAFGFPYARMGHHMFGEVDYAGICDAFYDFYMSYQYPYGTIGVTVCAELEGLAAVMKRINERYEFDDKELNNLQSLDGYSPVRFFDLGDYVRHLCRDQALLSEFEEQLDRAVPSAYHRHTPEYYSMSNGINPIRTYSGITTSDPSISGSTAAKDKTAWWKATHLAAGE